MKVQIKTFQWICDCCSSKQHSQSLAGIHASKPAGWLSVYTQASFNGCGIEYDYCPDCISTATQTHSPTEDNHFGTILRFLQSQKDKERSSLL